MARTLTALQFASFVLVSICSTKLAFANPSSCERKVYATAVNPPVYSTAANGSCPPAHCNPPCSDDTVTIGNVTWLICSCGGSQSGCTTAYQDDGFGNPYVGGSVTCLSYCDPPWCPFADWEWIGTQWQLVCGDC